MRLEVKKIGILRETKTKVTPTLVMQTRRHQGRFLGVDWDVLDEVSRQTGSAGTLQPEVDETEVGMAAF